MIFDFDRTTISNFRKKQVQSLYFNNVSKWLGVIASFGLWLDLELIDCLP